MRSAISDKGSGILGSRAVLWDLDGTLVDSRDHHWHAWRDTMRGEGVDLGYEQFLASFGQKNDAILAAWLGVDTPAERVQRIGDLKEALYREHARREGVALLPGAIEWVRGLHNEGWLQAIASSAPRANVQAVIEVVRISDLIDAIVSAEDVTAGKPDPQVFLIAANRLKVSPADCVVVEDAAAGVEAGRRAGMKTIGVHPDALLPADISVRSLAELETDTFVRLLNS